MDVDHRRLGWADSGTAELRARHVEEVLAYDERVIVFLLAIRGASVDSGGPFEIA